MTKIRLGDHEMARSLSLWYKNVTSLLCLPLAGLAHGMSVRHMQSLR